PRARRGARALAPQAASRAASARRCAAPLPSSGRLLRRHLVHFAGIEVEAHAVDLVEVGAGDADEARAVRIVDRVDRAVLVDAGLPGIEPIALRLLQLGVLVVAADALPFDHLG